MSETGGGIGTPATRDKFVPLLEKRGFISIEKQKIIPTRAGLDFYNALPPIITQPDMTALWSEKQQDIEQEEMTVDAFIESLYQDIQKLLVGDFAEKLLITSISDEISLSSLCPNCGQSVLVKPKLFVCKAQCGFKVWKKVSEKLLSAKQVDTLITKSKTKLIKGFKSQAGKSFDARLSLQDKSTGKLGFEFEKKQVKK